MTRCSFGLHAWLRWREYLWTGYIYYKTPWTLSTADGVKITERRQKRVCRLCGKVQDRLVRG